MGKRERGRCKKQQQEEEEIKVRQQSPTMLPLAHSGEKRGGEGSLGRAPAKCVSENSQGGGGNNNSAVSLAAVCLLVHLLLPLIPTSAPSAAAAWEVPPDRFSFHILTHSFNSSPPFPPSSLPLPRLPPFFPAPSLSSSTTTAKSKSRWPQFSGLPIPGPEQKGPKNVLFVPEDTLGC